MRETLCVTATVRESQLSDHVSLIRVLSFLTSNAERLCFDRQRIRHPGHARALETAGSPPTRDLRPTPRRRALLHHQSPRRRRLCFPSTAFQIARSDLACATAPELPSPRKTDCREPRGRACEMFSLR